MVVVCVCLSNFAISSLSRPHSSTSFLVCLTSTATVPYFSFLRTPMYIQHIPHEMDTPDVVGVSRQGSPSSPSPTPGSVPATTAGDNNGSGVGNPLFYVWLLVFLGAMVFTKFLLWRIRRASRAREQRRGVSTSLSEGGDGSNAPTRLERVATFVLPSAAAVTGTTETSHRASRPIKLESIDAPKEVAGDVCAICLSPLADFPVSQASCPHWLHSKCYHAWLVKDSKQACPVCRTPYQPQLKLDPSPDIVVT